MMLITKPILLNAGVACQNSQYFHNISKDSLMYIVVSLRLRCKYFLIDYNQLPTKVFFLLSIGSLGIMIFSPEFRWRSSFSSLVFLLISVGMIRELRNSAVIESDHSTKLSKAIHFAMCVYVVCTVLFSTYIFSISKLQNNIMMEQIAAEKKNPTNQILLIKEGSAFVEKNFLFCFFATGGHLPYVYTLTQNENYWINRDVALYYGIKGLKQWNELKNDKY